MNKLKLNKYYIRAKNATNLIAMHAYYFETTLLAIFAAA
jgi:hypothetical protein